MAKKTHSDQKYTDMDNKLKNKIGKNLKQKFGLSLKEMDANPVQAAQYIKITKNSNAIIKLAKMMNIAES